MTIFLVRKLREIHYGVVIKNEIKTGLFYLCLTILIFTLLILNGCSSKRIHQPYFDKYIQTFENHCKKYRSNCEVTTKIIFRKVVDGGKTLAAVCLHSLKMVYINPSQWRTMRKYQREALVLHELGHCELKRSHHSSIYEGFMESIMHWALIDNDKYELFREEYIYELFTGDSRKLKKSIDKFYKE